MIEGRSNETMAILGYYWLQMPLQNGLSKGSLLAYIISGLVDPRNEDDVRPHSHPTLLPLISFSHILAFFFFLESPFT